MADEFDSLQDFFGMEGTPRDGSISPESNLANELEGNPIEGPSPGPDPSKGTGGYYDLFYDLTSTTDQWAQDPYAHARPTSYDSSHLGANFERYYTHDLYNKIGFNPYRDNESMYNSNSSWWQDFKRMSKVYPSLFGTMFTSPYDFGSENSSKALEHAMATAGSGKEGVGGFFIDLGLQSAITLGIAAELIAENFALAGITAATGGAAGPAAFAKAMHSSAMGVKKISDLRKAYKSLKAAMTEMKSIDAAKTVYQSSNASKGAKAAWDFMNPLSRTQDYATSLIKGTNGMKEMGNFAKTRKAFGAFYRDLREINLVAAESLMEGNMQRDEVHRDAINEFYKKEGRMPNETEAKRIYEKAMNTSFGVAMANAPVIYFTNKLVFDDLLSGFKPPSVIGKELLKGSARTLAKTGQKVGDDVYSAMQKTVSKKVKDRLFKSSYLPWSRKYIAANLSEGIQELSQEAVASGMTDYYDKLYRDPLAGGLYNMAASMGMGVGEQASMQGLEVFASGFLMGGIVKGVGAVATAPKLLPQYYKGVTDKKSLADARAKQEENENKTLKAVNNILKDPLNNFNRIVEHALRMKQVSMSKAQAEEAGDQKAFQDAKNQELMEHLYELTSSGRLDLVTEHLRDMNALNDKDFADAFGLKETDVTEARERLQDNLNQVNKFKKTYEMWNEKYPNPFAQLIRSKDKEQSAAAIISYGQFEEAKKIAILSEGLLGKTVDRAEKLTSELTEDAIFGETKGSDITVLLDEGLLDNEISVLKEEVKAYKSGDAALKAEGEKKERKLRLLIDWKLSRKMFAGQMKAARKVQASEDEILNMGNYPPGYAVKYKNDKGIYEVVSTTDKMVIVRDNNGKLRRVMKTSVEPAERRPVYERMMEGNNQILHDVFREYIDEIADGRNASDEVINKAFQKIRDKFNLEEEATMLNKTLNMLADPGSFFDFAKRMVNVKANIEESIKTSLETLNKQYGEDNVLLNRLFQAGVYPSPEMAKSVIQDGELENLQLLDVHTGDVLSPTDSRYNNAMQHVIDYVNNQEKESIENEEEIEEPGSTDTSSETTTVGEDGYTDEQRDALLKIIRAENLIRKAANEVQLSEDFSDTETNEFIRTNSKARKILNLGTKTEAEETETEDEPNDETPTQTFENQEVPEGLKVISKVYDKPVILTDDGSVYVDEDGNKYLRVSTIKGDFKSTPERALDAERETLIDFLLIEYINGNLEITKNPKKYSSKFADDTTVKRFKTALNGYRAEAGYKVKFTDRAIDDAIRAIYTSVEHLNDEGYKLYGHIPALKGEIAGIKFAGTTDILAEKDGNYYIIDLETANKDFSRRSKAGKNKHLAGDTIQLNAYAELFKQSSGGIPISGVFILPFGVQHELNNHAEVAYMELDRGEADDPLLIKIEMSDIEELASERLAELNKGKTKKSAPKKRKTTKKKTSTKKKGVSRKKDYAKAIAKAGLRQLDALSTEINHLIEEGTDIGMDYQEAIDLLEDRMEEIHDSIDYNNLKKGMAVYVILEDYSGVAIVSRKYKGTIVVTAVKENAQGEIVKASIDKRDIPTFIQNKMKSQKGKSAEVITDKKSQKDSNDSVKSGDFVNESSALDTKASESVIANEFLDNICE